MIDVDANDIYLLETVTSKCKIGYENRRKRTRPSELIQIYYRISKFQYNLLPSLFLFFLLFFLLTIFRHFFFPRLIRLHLSSFTSNWRPSFRALWSLHLQLYVGFLVNTDKTLFADSQNKNIVVAIQRISRFCAFISNRHDRLLAIAVVKQTGYFENNRLTTKLRRVTTRW